MNNSTHDTSIKAYTCKCGREYILFQDLSDHANECTGDWKDDPNYDYRTRTTKKGGININSSKAKAQSRLFLYNGNSFR